MSDYQSKVAQWVIDCFGYSSLISTKSRSERFIEESIELVQSVHMPKEHVLALVEHVYSRPIGDVEQEVGGVMVTLSALCTSQNITLSRASNKGLLDCVDRKEKIIKKQHEKLKL